MKQTSFASLEYACKKRKTRRKRFPCEMQQLVPWSALIALIEPRSMNLFDAYRYLAALEQQRHLGHAAACPSPHGLRRA